MPKEKLTTNAKSDGGLDDIRFHNLLEGYVEKLAALDKMITETESQALPTNPLRYTTTDADGRYKLALVGNGHYTIAAVAKRQVGDDVETYCWIEGVDADGKNELDLSNLNMRPIGLPRHKVLLLKTRITSLKLRLGQGS